MGLRITLLGKEQSYEELSNLLQTHSEVDSVEESEIVPTIDTLLTYDVIISHVEGKLVRDLVYSLQDAEFKGLFISTSTDFRITDVELLKKFYKKELKPTKIPFSYFLPELTPTLKSHYVNMPGMVSAAILPLVCSIMKVSNITEFWITVITPNYVETESRFQAYDVFTYSELGEIMWYCEQLLGTSPKINLIPVHASIDRGLWCTINVTSTNGTFLFESLKQELSLYEWIRCAEHLPSLGETLHTNEVHVGWRSSENNSVIAVAMDEKRRCGTAQCVQAINSFFGFQTNLGLG